MGGFDDIRISSIFGAENRRLEMGACYDLLAPKIVNGGFSDIQKRKIEENFPPSTIVYAEDRRTPPSSIYGFRPRKSKNPAPIFDFRPRMMDRRSAEDEGGATSSKMEKGCIEDGGFYDLPGPKTKKNEEPFPIYYFRRRKNEEPSPFSTFCGLIFFPV